MMSMDAKMTKTQKIQLEGERKTATQKESHIFATDIAKKESQRPICNFSLSEELSMRRTDQKPFLRNSKPTAKMKTKHILTNS